MHYPYISQKPADEAETFTALIDLARYLRTPDGCPWDREQNSKKFAMFHKEEGQEMIDAFEEGDDALEEEFGDCLFTLLAMVAAAEEEGRFTLESAMRRSLKKMIRRHDHVFGEKKAATAEEAVAAWDKVKAEEKG